MKFLRVYIASLLLTFCACLSASPQDVDTALAAYDSVQSVSNANSFFEVLLQEGLVDDTVSFDIYSSAEEINFNVCYWAAEWYNEQQRYKTAEVYGVRALESFFGTPGQKADALGLLAVVNIRLGQFEQAAQYAKQCYDMDLTEGDPDHISSSLNTLAAIYIMTRQFDEAEKFILESIKYAEQTGNLCKVALVKGTASEVFFRKGDNLRSLQYATEAYHIETSLGRKNKAAIRQAQRASALIAMGRYTEAQGALNEAIPEFRSDGNRHSLGIACNQMGILMHAQGNDSAAVRYYKEALGIFGGQNDIFNLCQTHKGLHDALRHIDVEQALYHGDCYNQLRDSLYDNETGMLLSKYAAEYDNYHLQMQNRDLRRKNTERVILLVAVLVILLVVAPVAFIVSRRHHHRRLEKLLQEIELLQAQLKKESAENQDDADDATANEIYSSLTEEEKLFLAEVVQVVREAKAEACYSVESVAAHFNMTPQTFRRRIFSLTGELPNAFINAVRMQKAGQMLKADTAVSVSDVALACGYDEISTFSRSFKRFHGVSPSDFRKQNK